MTRAFFVVGMLAGLLSCKTVVQPQAVALPMAANKIIEAPLPLAPPQAYVSTGKFWVAGLAYQNFHSNESGDSCVSPAAVHWGFASGSPAARQCMQQAYESLWHILYDPPQELLQLKSLGGPSGFILWVNDYTEAVTEASGRPIADCRAPRSQRGIWHYKPPGGLIHWVVEVNKDGTCNQRTLAELVSFCNEETNRLRPQSPEDG